MVLPGLRVCFFDVNGVLIDSNRANARAMGRAFSADPAIQDHVAALYLKLTGIDRGSKIRIIQEKILGSPFHEKEFDERWASFARLSRESMLNATLTQGCKEVLRELGARKIMRAALSNTPLHELKETLTAHGLDSFLDLIRGGGDWPKSESLMLLLQERGFQRSDCLFFGDGKGDLTAARRAGVKFVAIDPTGEEFEDDEGFDGPYRSLSEWALKMLGQDFG